MTAALSIAGFLWAFLALLVTAWWALDKIVAHLRRDPLVDQLEGGEL